MHSCSMYKKAELVTASLSKPYTTCSVWNYIKMHISMLSIMNVHNSLPTGLIVEFTCAWYLFLWLNCYYIQPDWQFVVNTSVHVQVFTVTSTLYTVCSICTIVRQCSKPKRELRMSHNFPCQIKSEGITRWWGLFTTTINLCAPCAIAVIYPTWLVLCCYYCINICTCASVYSNSNIIYCI